MLNKIDEMFDAALEPTTFDPESMTVADIPAAAWYALTRLLPIALVLGGSAWLLIAMGLVL